MNEVVEIDMLTSWQARIPDPEHLKSGPMPAVNFMIQ